MDPHEQMAAAPEFNQARSIEELFVKDAPKRRRPKPRRRQRERLTKLLGKSQQGFGTAPAGRSVAWAAIPEATRAKLEPSMGEQPTVGWSLGDLDSEDMVTLRRLMGRKGWNQWLRTQRAQLNDPGWSPVEGG